MLRIYWTDFTETFTIRRAVVWNGDDFDIIFIGSLYVVEIDQKLLKTVADEPFNFN